jgi:parvulin-like peptidyl-prolyl isomerase
MPYYINGQLLPEEFIRQQAGQIARHPGWNNIADDGERQKRIWADAVRSAQDQALIAQEAGKDPRPIDSQHIEQEVERLKKNGNCRQAYDDSAIRQVVEHGLRVERLLRELTQDVPEPTAEEIESFYQANRENFRGPERFRAAHIVKHVNELQTEEQAEASIAVALGELERGDPFAEVAERHSDCKDSGGDLGEFPAGEMVEEFEEAIRALEPGQRTGIFTTPFGFHIAKLIAKIPAGAAPFEDCRQDIKNTFTMRNQHACYLRKIAELRAQADIRFVPDSALQATA